MHLGGHVTCRRSLSSCVVHTENLLHIVDQLRMNEHGCSGLRMEEGGQFEGVGCCLRRTPHQPYRWVILRPNALAHIDAILEKPLIKSIPREEDTFDVSLEFILKNMVGASVFMDSPAVQLTKPLSRLGRGVLICEPSMLGNLHSFPSPKR